MLPHNHKELTSVVTESIDFLSEQSPFYTESIQYAKHSHKNKSHIPPEERNLIFPRQQQQQQQQASNSNWFDQEDTDFDDFFGEQPTNEKVMAPSVNQQTYVHEDQVFLDGGSCDFDEMDLFTNTIDSTPQQPQLKKAKYDHHSSTTTESSSSSTTTVAVKQPNNNQDNTLLSILIREQQKQGAEISELKQMVHNLQAQILMHPMYQQQYALYQQHQQQQYQLYLQQNQQQENKQ